MSDLAIRVEGLGKRYRIGQTVSYKTLRESVIGLAGAPLRRFRSPRRQATDDTVWAVRDISFQVCHGDVLGIIGRNGAGKSTLLKLLSRITEPTEGEIELRGRVGCLLEVGTGFHPELTGRENIFLNGAILGMKREEIKSSFNQITEFAEIGKFLDTPVKRYSSGMRVRLGFSVAAHLNPEILIVDEVLAVGDANFQQKCLGKMDEIAHGGRTVLFVSHNLAAVENLCHRAIVLDQGRVIADEPVGAAIETYLQTLGPSEGSGNFKSVPRPSDMKSIIQQVEILDDSGRNISAIQTNDPCNFRIHYDIKSRDRDLGFALIFENHTGTRVFRLASRTQCGPLGIQSPHGIVSCRVPRLPLLAGYYFISVVCGQRGQRLDRLERALRLQVVESDIYGTGRISKGSRFLVSVDADWEVFHDETVKTI